MLDLDFVSEQGIPCLDSFTIEIVRNKEKSQIEHHSKFHIFFLSATFRKIFTKVQVKRIAMIICIFEI